MIKFLKNKIFFNLVNFLLNKKKEDSKFFSIMHNTLINILSFVPYIKLSQLFFVTGTDKYTQYKFLYDNILQGLINKKNVKKLLEIGIGGHSKKKNSGKSLVAFSKFYKSAKIYGIDLSDKSFLNNKKITTKICDQGKPKDLLNFEKNNGPFDIIIDDGSHFTHHQKTSFDSLFKKLNYGGIYIIEDVGTSYLKGYFGDPNLSNKNVVTYFSGLTHGVNNYQLIKKYQNKYKKYLEISVILFIKDAIIIKKEKTKKKSFNRYKAFQSLKKWDPYKTKGGLKIFNK